MNQFPALYRKYPNSEIVETFWDSEKQMVLDTPFKIPIEPAVKGLPIVVIADYYSSAMYNLIRKYSGIHSIVLFNNTKLYCRFDDKVVIYDTHGIPTGEYETTPKLKTYIFPRVGFLKTYTRRYNATILPTGILYDEINNLIYVKDKWVKPKRKPRVDIVPKLDVYYESLKDKDSIGAYLTKAGIVLI